MPYICIYIYLCIFIVRFYIGALYTPTLATHTYPWVFTYGSDMDPDGLRKESADLCCDVEAHNGSQDIYMYR